MSDGIKRAHEDALEAINLFEKGLIDLGQQKYIVYAPDGVTIITVLNSSLAKRQGVTEDQLEALKLSHQLRWELFESAKMITGGVQSEADEYTHAERLKLKLLAAMFDALESEQQRLWNFKVDVNHHRFFDFPGCTCPKLDNEERLGTSYKIFNKSCPIHGSWDKAGFAG